MRLVVVRGLQGLPNDTVVVDFAIDGQSQGAIIVDQGLGTGVDTDDTQTLVGEDGSFRDKVAAPVGSTMAHSLGHAQSRRLELLHIRVMMTREDTTHFDHEQLSARSIRRREWRRELTKREEKYGGGREF
jgi:uncharacterized cupin superfamily protein